MVIFRGRRGGGEEFLSKKIKEANTFFTAKFFKSGAKTFSTKKRANTIFSEKIRGKDFRLKKRGKTFFWTIQSPK